MNTLDPTRSVGASRLPTVVACAALAGVSFSTPALAYVGPGAGLGVIGTLFGIVAALVLAMFGLFWYPIKRAFGKKRASVEGPATTGTPADGIDETAERGEDERPR